MEVGTLKPFVAGLAVGARVAEGGGIDEGGGGLFEEVVEVVVEAEDVLVEVDGLVIVVAARFFSTVS